MILEIKKAYRWVQAMSLDVVLGSGLLSLTVAKCYGVKLPWVVMLGLMIAVWLIYTFDHLADAKKVKAVASTYRHRFHQQHYRVIKVVLLLMALAGVALVYFLPLVVIRWGVLCTGLVAVYFLLLKRRFFWFKELLIGACYTLGVFLGPLSLLQQELSFFQLLLIPQVLLLALANLIIFSCFDYQHDQQDGHYSLPIHLGLGGAKKIAFSLLAAGLVLCAVVFFSADLLIVRKMQLLMFVMNLLLLMLLLREQRFRQDDLYRMVGDGIFFLPALALVYAG